MAYSRSDISHHFQTTPETIRRWSKDFARFLSDGTNDSNRSQYTDEDMTVLVYVHEAYRRNESTEDIIASVAGGARGDFDGYLKRHSVAITEADAVAINQLRVERDSLQAQLIEANQKIAVLESQVSDTEKLRAEIKDLYRSIGKLEMKIEVLQDNKKAGS